MRIVVSQSLSLHKGTTGTLDTFPRSELSPGRRRRASELTYVQPVLWLGASSGDLKGRSTGVLVHSAAGQERLPAIPATFP